MSENTPTQESAPDIAATADSKENANSADSSPVQETTTDQTGSSDQDKTQTENKTGGENFADHPRWKEREDDWSKRFNDQEQRHVAELDKIRKDIETKFESKREKLADQEVPGWFGGDEQAWSQYKAHEDSRLAQAEERAIQRMEQKAANEKKLQDDATAYMNSEIKLIESDKSLNPTGEKVDPNKLWKTVLDFKLMDTEGRWNYRAAYAFMKNHGSKSTASTDEKKKLANATIFSESHAESKRADYMTSEDFKKPGARPW